jgi:hypothetical protein
MKKTTFLWSLLLCFSTFLSAQTQKQIYEDMLKWLNDNPAQTDDRSDYRGYELLMTNNTIRPGQGGKIIQYASYAKADANSPMSPSSRELRVSPARTFLEYKKVEQLFSDRDLFKGKRDELDIKIYMTGGKVKVDIKVLTWGNAITKHDAVIAKTAHGGFVIQFSGNNANFFTITLKPEAWDLPG